MSGLFTVARLAHVWTSSHNIADVARPFMRRLWESTSETVALFVPEGIYRVCIEEMESPQPLSFRRGVGYREKLVLGASGRSILAHMKLSPEALRPYIAKSGRDAAKFAKELKQIAAHGFTTSHHELIEGAVAVAAPFFNGADRVAGSLSIFGPSIRVTDERVEHFGALLVREAAELSYALGRR